MIELTALKRAPGFARSRVRDVRVRWALEETALPCRVRLIDARRHAGMRWGELA